LSQGWPASASAWHLPMPLQVNVCVEHESAFVPSQPPFFPCEGSQGSPYPSPGVHLPSTHSLPEPHMHGSRLHGSPVRKPPPHDVWLWLTRQ
jgi:hypothetical protein